MAVKNKNTQGDLSSRELILIFILLVSGIIGAGQLYYSNYAKSYRTQAEQQLSAIANLKVGELVQWRKERLADANLLYTNTAFSSLVQRYLEHPDDLDAQEQLRSWLTRFQAYDQYARIFLLDTRGAGRIFVPDTAEPVPHHITQDAYQVLQSGKVTILDLDRDEDTPQPHMAILIPIFREKDGNLPLGTVVMRIDPYQYLYPLIQSWPTPSATAETLLIRRDGNDALFLNELRFQKDTALKLRVSLENIMMPAVQAALGHKEIVEGIDYRGVPVIADVRPVPDSPWFLVALMESSEVYTPLTQMLWVIIALVGSLLIGASAGVGLVWRQQNIRVYKERAEITNALRESEERYRDLVNFSKNGVAVYVAAADGEDFIFTDFNRAAERIDNIKKEDIIGKSILQVFPGIKEFGLFEVFQRVWRTGVPERHPISQYHDDRISGWRDNYVYRLPSGEIVAIYEDVTERKQAEEALKESEQELRTSMENAPDGIYMNDLEGNFLYGNLRCEELTGYKREELIGKNFVELNILTENSLARAAELLKANRKSKSTGPDELDLIRKDGRLVPVEISSSVVRHGGQNIVLAFARDITERKQAEEALRSEQMMLTRTEGVAHIGSWEWDIATDTVTWSDELFRIFQRDPQEGAPSFAGHPALYHPEDMARLRQAVEVCVADGTPYELELRGIRKDGETRACVARGFAEMAPGGRPVRLFGSLQDITERKQEEENLEKSHRELRNLSVHLISLREEERMLLAREIHDELGQALTALKMALSWLSKKSPEGPNGEKIATMLNLVNTTMKMVKRLSTELRPGLLDDLGLVAAMEWQAGEFQERTGIKTELGFEPDDIRVGDEQATTLFRIFQEMLTNVARHAAATSIEAYLHEKDGELELVVRDNGKGIEPKMIASSKSLGLIGMRERCHHLGGIIDIRGKRGKGTTVIVKLPAREKRA